MSNRLCLIVDDEPSIRGYLSAVLESEHFQFLEAGTASQALKITEMLDGQLDLIISDVNMPGDMDGIDLALSVHNSFPSIPVILISGYVEQQSRRLPKAIFEFVTKPISPEKILGAVRRTLD
jgi:CheY-like chemotaxis protein